MACRSNRGVSRRVVGNRRGTRAWGVPPVAGVLSASATSGRNSRVADGCSRSGWGCMSIGSANPIPPPGPVVGAWRGGLGCDAPAGRRAVVGSRPRRKFAPFWRLEARQLLGKLQKNIHITTFCSKSQIGAICIGSGAVSGTPVGWLARPCAIQLSWLHAVRQACPLPLPPRFHRSGRGFGRPAYPSPACPVGARRGARPGGAHRRWRCVVRPAVRPCPTFAWRRRRSSRLDRTGNRVLSATVITGCNPPVAARCKLSMWGYLSGRSADPDPTARHFAGSGFPDSASSPASENDPIRCGFRRRACRVPLGAGAPWGLLGGGYRASGFVVGAWCTRLGRDAPAGRLAAVGSRPRREIAPFWRLQVL
jgi:hypothetical protein